MANAGSANTTRKVSNSWGWGVVIVTLAIVAIAFLMVHLVEFETAAFPMHEFGKAKIVAARKNAASLPGLEKIGMGELIGAEDLAYEPKSGVVYTGCHDGWIKRLRLNDSVVDNWVNTGGRPLGIAVDDSGDVFVADAFKGLLKVSIDGKLELLTDEGEGIKVGFADGVVIAKDGIVYFTDASYKYGFDKPWYELLDGRPHGRLLTYDPSTKETKVIARDLYFANGVELSLDQDFVIFCETFMRRCFRYYIQGEKKGSTDIFTDNLPGMPDNIHYDGDGHYLVGMLWGNSLLTKFVMPYQFVRKILAFTVMHLNKMPELIELSGVMVLDLEGNPVGGFYDEEWMITTSGLKIGENLYMGSLTKPYVLRLNLTQNPFTIASS